VDINKWFKTNVLSLNFSKFRTEILMITFISAITNILMQRKLLGIISVDFEATGQL
jgi:hypothetical protein